MTLTSSLHTSLSVATAAGDQDESGGMTPTGSWLSPEFEVETGSTLWVSVSGDDAVMGDTHFPATHDAANTGSERYREILVELK